VSVKLAFDRLGTWTVAGVKTPYPLNTQPNQVPYTSLPALVITPPTGGADAPFDLGLSKSACVLMVDHTLLVSGISGSYFGARVYATLDLIDAYFAKVKTDWTLNGQLLEPLQISGVRFATINYGGSAYNAVIFPHKWVLTL